MKAWIYEICNNHETDEKYIKFNLRHAFHKGYDVIGISRIQSSQAMKRTDSDNFQKISATIREAAAAGAEVIITSYFEGYCKSAYEEMRKKLLCDELGMKFETSVSEVTSSVDRFERLFFNNRFRSAPLDKIDELYDHYYALGQQKFLSVRDDIEADTNMLDKERIAVLNKLAQQESEKKSRGFADGRHIPKMCQDKQDNESVQQALGYQTLL